MVVERLDRALNLYRGITDQELMKQLVYVETGWIQNIKWPLQVRHLEHRKLAYWSGLDPVEVRKLDVCLRELKIICPSKVPVRNLHIAAYDVNQVRALAALVAVYGSDRTQTPEALVSATRDKLGPGEISEAILDPTFDGQSPVFKGIDPKKEGSSAHSKRERIISLSVLVDKNIPLRASPEPENERSLQPEMVVYSRDEAEASKKEKRIVGGQEIEDEELEEILFKASEMFDGLLEHGKDSISLHVVRFGRLAGIFGMENKGNVLETKFESVRDEGLFRFIEPGGQGGAYRYKKTQFLAGAAEAFISIRHSISDENLVEVTEELLGPGPIADELIIDTGEDLDLSKLSENESDKLSRLEKKLLVAYDISRVEEIKSRIPRFREFEGIYPIDAAAVKAAWENGLKLSPNAIFSRVLEIAEMAYGVLHNVPFRTRQEMTFKELRERIDACLFFMNDYVPNLYSLWQIIYDTDKRKINND